MYLGDWVRAPAHQAPSEKGLHYKEEVTFNGSKFFPF